jgi:hypothetical protein
MNTTDSKKLKMADKMYNQNSKGGVGKSPKDYQNGKTDRHFAERDVMNGKGKGKEIEKSPMANKKGSFVDKYEQANEKGSFAVKYKQANC